MIELRAPIAYLLLALCVLFWSGNVVIVRALRSEIGPFALSFWRWATAFGVLLPLFGRDILARWPLIRSGWRGLVAAGILGMGAYSTLVYLGLQSTTATNAALINASVPVLIAALAGAMFRHRLSWIEWLGVVLSLAGVGLIIANADGAHVSGAMVTRGDLWIVLAVAGFVVYTVCFQRSNTGLPPSVYLIVTIAIAATAVAPFYLWECVAGPEAVVSVRAVAGIAYLALFPSLLSYYFWVKGVESIGPARAGMFLYLLPVFTTLLAVCFLDEHLGWFHAAGALLIVCGIWFTASGKYRASRQSMP